MNRRHFLSLAPAAGPATLPTGTSHAAAHATARAFAPWRPTMITPPT